MLPSEFPGRYRLIGTAVSTGRVCRVNLLLLVCLGLAGGSFSPAPAPAPAPTPAPRIALSEFMAIPDADGVEFVEVLVGGGSPLSGSRIALRDATVSWRTLSEEARLFMPGQYVVATPDTLAFLAKHGPLPGNAVLLQLRPWPTLNNGGDSLLVSVDGHVVDRTGWSGVDVVRGTSRERIATVLPGTLREAWATSTTPPGTPGFRNATHVDDTLAPRVLGVEWDPDRGLLVWLDERVDTGAGRGPNGLGGARIHAGAAHPGLADIRLECHFPGETVCKRLRAPVPSAWLSRFVPDGHPLTEWPVEVEGMVDLWGNLAERSHHPVHVPPRPGDVRISEVMTRGTPDNPEFVELVVDAIRPVSLRNTTLSTSRADDLLTAEDEALLLAPHAVHVVMADLLISGETLVVRERAGMAPSGPPVDSVRIGPDLEDGRFRSHQGRSLRRVGGAARDWASSLSPASTPGSDPDGDLRRRAAPPRPTSGPPPLVLTEVMYDPLMDPHDNHKDQTAFLEWTNRSAEPVHLFGAHLLHERNERGEQDTLRIGYQPMTVLPDSSVVIMWTPSHVADGQVVDDEATRTFLAGIWPETPPSVRIQPVRASLGLRNSGRELTLVDGGGNLLSSDTYAPDAHHPMVEVTKGRSLERRRLGAGWSQLETSVHDHGATPGRVTGVIRPGTNAHPDPAFGSGTGASQLSSSPIAHVEPKSFYPDRPDLGAWTHIVVQVPPEMGTRVATVTVFSRHGHPVRQLATGQPVSGTTTFKWDGFDHSGVAVQAGIHFIVVRLGDTPTWHSRLPVAVLRR